MLLTLRNWLRTRNDHLIAAYAVWRTLSARWLVFSLFELPVAIATKGRICRLPGFTLLAALFKAFLPWLPF